MSRVSPRQIPIALTIAGSDSGGGAGIQADLKTFHAFGVFGTSAITAITAQNTVGVFAVHAVPVDVVREQIRVLVDDLRPDALKSGMLATAELVRAIAQAIQEHELESYVLDPVMVASSGDRLLDQDAESAVAEALVPLATVVTPNLHEAGILTRRKVVALEDMRAAARALVDMGARAALVKGGHLEEDEVIDLLWDGSEERLWRHPRIRTRNIHGTGCTLSSAIAAGLAAGRSLAEAVGDAVDFVHRAIAQAPGLGHGHGPVNHLVSAPRAVYAEAES
ncbi:MAG: bifunctional hydroxymethylpyrimidine kinase/phosphomethylpyrimidine kinase [Gemmatimonadetes bacterium]|nr:bifunctional hydroxymethylpyrimidine kinase/phosphomethylpyrimidine kinase [Gemmatimonadota bacterium]